jgi:glycerol-3-phosphate dehydrogenase
MNQRPEFSFRTRQHFWQHLKNHKDMTLNAVVVGGGIVGAGILREFGLQGIPLVFLFEKNDFASATSGASSKLIHAGIRYLEQSWNNLKKADLKNALRNFKFVWDASRERKTLGALAPALVKPKPIYFVIGTADGRNPLSVVFGIWAYWLMQWLQGQRFSAPEIYLRSKSIRQRFPELATEKVKAVFSFWDSETDDARLVIENLQNAHECGCYAMNYADQKH